MQVSPIQRLVDRQVAGSPRARELLSQLTGKRLRIAVRHTPLHITAVATTGQLQLLLTDTTAADATLSGTPLGMLAMTREAPETVIRRGDVQLSGDADAGVRFQELLQLLRPDLEEMLARVIGEIPAFGAGRVLQQTLDYGRSVLRTGALNVGEFLAHERGVLVPRAEAHPFLQAVDELREATDRLQSRVAILESANPESVRVQP
jgi:ubiquinone biosynthesis protein UbiJ